MKRIAVLLIISAAILSACTNSKWVRAPIDKQYEFIVTLEQQQEKGSIIPQRYQHPVKIDLADLKKLLAELTYIEKAGLTNDSKQSPVFQAEEIDRLAPPLTEALEKVDASQRIRFTSYTQGKALIFSVSQKTEAVIFVDSEGRLNVAFNYINSRRDPSDTSAFYHRYSNVDPLKIVKSDASLALPVSYAKYHTFENGKQAPLWIVVDLEKLKNSNVPVKSAIVNGAEEMAPVVTPKTSTIVHPAITKETASAPEDQFEENIKNKLKFLKELLEEGLISETDYNAKKMGLLKGI